ncbi:hypothetical protein NY486_29600, partial [Enterobacter hormaechei]|nr:hypothetical protein [Enterobacter hormaechei]
RQRLLALARGWDRFHLAGIDLVAFASNPEPLVLPDDVATLHLQFYPPQDSAAAPSASPVKATHSALAAPHETPTRPSLAHAKSEQRAALTPLQSKIPQPVL